MPKEKPPAKLNPELQRILESMREKAKARDLAEEAKEAAGEIHKEIGKPKPEQTWLPFAPMPTDMCRVSPFFPMGQRQLKDRPFIEDMVITKSSWGEIRYTGPKLSTFDEDVLLSVLALLDTAKNREESTDAKGRPTYTYRGPLLPILKLIGVSKAGSTNYNRVIKSLKRMSLALFELDTKERWVINPILIHADYDKGTKELAVTINPFFYETYMAGSVTLMDVLQRSRITRPVTKALYRFVMSHRDSKWPGHFLTLAASMNLDLEQPQFRIRSQIKTAITELKKQGILDSKSRLDKNDLVTLIRAPLTRPKGKPKTLSE